MKNENPMNTQTFCRYVSAILLGLMCCGASLQATAKTVALWKLDYSPYTGMNTRCLIDPANDFDVIIQGQQKEPPSSRPPLPSGFPQVWSPLPPNPDTTADLLDSPASTNAIYYPQGEVSAPGARRRNNGDCPCRRGPVRPRRRDGRAQRAAAPADAVAEGIMTSRSLTENPVQGEQP